MKEEEQILSWSCGKAVKPGETYLDHIKDCLASGELGEPERPEDHPLYGEVL